MLLKVGELARRSGVTVRTLHHYDNLDLLKPSARSDAGYRLYDRKDVERLHHIQALRGLGLSLTDIGALLNQRAVSLPGLIDQQLLQLDRQLQSLQRLRSRTRSTFPPTNWPGWPSPNASTKAPVPGPPWLSRSRH